MYFTKDEIKMEFGAGQIKYPITIPKGTRCKEIHKGDIMGKFWVDDLSFLDWKTQGIVLHDATFYGIILEPHQVENLTDMGMRYLLRDGAPWAKA
jgi:hypothetical protein